VSRIVVDASVATMWFASEAESAAAATLLDGEDELIVPDLLYVETANALWKKQAIGEISIDIVEDCLVRLIALDLIVVSAKILLRAAFQLAARAHHPVHDCVYVVLAQQRQAVLATADKRLARLAMAQHVEIWTPAADPAALGKSD
jgi:predicted nucleic acid-binding protein